MIVRSIFLKLMRVWSVFQFKIIIIFLKRDCSVRNILKEVVPTAEEGCQSLKI